MGGGIKQFWAGTLVGRGIQQIWERTLVGGWKHTILVGNIGGREGTLMGGGIQQF